METEICNRKGVVKRVDGVKKLVICRAPRTFHAATLENIFCTNPKCKYYFLCHCGVRFGDHIKK